MAHLLFTPLITFVAQKAGNSLIQQFCQMHGMKKNRKKLHRQLLAIQAVIAEAESRQNEPQVQNWLEELNAAAYEAADVLDEFHYEALRQEVMHQKPSSSIKKVTKMFRFGEHSILFRKIMGKKLKNVLEKINDIITEMKNFSFIPRDPQVDNIIIRKETCSSVNESEIIGRNGEKIYIMNKIFEPICEKEEVYIFSIVGMGGVGKTTLAKLVYNEEKVKEHFDLRMWVFVQNDFDVANIVKSIIEQVATNEQGITTSTLEASQKKLREIIKGKKYLLVMDDVWNEERYKWNEKWDELKTLLESCACPGSVIIVTTRSKEVTFMKAAVLDLAMLSEKDSWELFQKRAFGKNEEIQRFIEVGRKIVDKCAGLPLALKTIGAVMRSKRDIHQWHALSKHKFWDNEASTNQILPALKVSYDHLPGHIKQCFSFCAIFPQNYAIEKETLIQLWMANDLIPTNEIRDLEGEGRDIFYELERRSFFQNIRESYYENNTRITCEMHDLIHDLAKHVAGKQCASLLELENSLVVHLSINNNPIPKNLNSVFKKLPLVRTYLDSNIFRPDPDPEDSKLSDLVKLIPLRALQVTSIKQLPKKDELNFMKHLRYLDLSGGHFDSLPETISTLYNLQTLKLSYSNISKLPDGMRYMVSLRHLFINGCLNLKRVPIGLGQLRYLLTLTNYMVECGSGRTLEELKNLNLHGFLSLSGLENVIDRNEAIVANMISKINLSSLTLQWGCQKNNDITRNDQEVLDGLEPATKLRALRLVCYTGFDIPGWLKNRFVLSNLRKLSFINCFNCTTLPLVWRLPLLEELELTGMRLIYICSSKGIEDNGIEQLCIFPKLKMLNISKLRNLKQWHETSDELVTFQQLEKLTIANCPQIRTIPCAPLLRYLSISKSRELKLLQISNLTMVAPSILSIDCESFTEHEAFRPPKNVVSLYVKGFEHVKPLGEDEEENNQKLTLRHLEMTNSNCFFSYGPSKLALTFWKLFASLETLCITECSALSFWPEQEFRSLKCLRELCIIRCNNFTCLPEVSLSSIISQQQLRQSLLSQISWGRLEMKFILNFILAHDILTKFILDFISIRLAKDILPQLEKLEILECPMLMEIPKCSKSMKELTLRNCPSLTKEGLNWLKNLHELKKLMLLYCEGLMSLPNGMEGLTSLKDLSIGNCPEMKSLPEGLQQRLFALEYLQIYGCPELQKRCRSGGDYFHLVSAIPSHFPPGVLETLTTYSWTIPL